jgi:hypothetical protein
MDIVAIVSELRRELQQIDNLILALDSLQSGRRRGRPPKLLQQLRSGAKPGVLTTRRAKKTGAKKARKRGRPRKKVSTS